MIQIDGSMGEGGGQILRTALSLSLCTGQSFRLTKIRASRPKPGLMRQHLTAVQAAAEVGQADILGDQVGSQELIFKPGKVRAGDYRFSVGTAGSATLVFQTILPALMLADTASTVVCEGGTHNPLAPPYDFLEKTFLTQITKMGVATKTELSRPGFYPAGGGKFSAWIAPTKKLKALKLSERGKLISRRVRILTADLPEGVAQREQEIVQEKLSWSADEIQIEKSPLGTGPGNIVMIELQYENVTEIFSAFGDRGVSAEKVVKQVIGRLQQYEKSDAPVGEFLADQLLIPCALCAGSTFVTSVVSPHTKTNAQVIRLFTEKEFRFQLMEGNLMQVF